MGRVDEPMRTFTPSLEWEREYGKFVKKKRHHHTRPVRMKKVPKALRRLLGE